MPIETTPAENGATSFTFSRNFAPFEIAACPDPNSHGLCKVLVHTVIDSLASTADQRAAIYDDAHLSGTGKDAKFDLIMRSHTLSIARISDQVDTLEEAANRDESQMLAASPIDPGHSVAASKRARSAIGLLACQSKKLSRQSSMVATRFCSP